MLWSGGHGVPGCTGEGLSYGRAGLGGLCPVCATPLGLEQPLGNPAPSQGSHCLGTPAFCLAQRVMDGRMDGRKRSWSCAGIPAVHLVAGYRHAQRSAARPLALPLHSVPLPPPAAALPGGGGPRAQTLGPWAVGVPLPTAAAVTAAERGLLWQRPGPAELPAHRRPDRQDRRLWALALQVQSKAGWGEEGAGGCTSGPHGTYTYTHTLCTKPCTPPPPPHARISPPQRCHGSPPAPGLCWGSGGGVLSRRPPCEGLSVPQDWAGPPGLASPGRQLPLSMKQGVCSPRVPWPPAQRGAMQPGLPVTARAGPDMPLCQGQVPAGSCLHVGVGAVCPSCLLAGRLGEAVGLEGAQDGEMGEAGGRMHWEVERRDGYGRSGGRGWGLGQREQSTCRRGGSGTWGAAMGWLGRAGGVVGPGTAFAAVRPVPYV